MLIKKTERNYNSVDLYLIFLIILLGFILRLSYLYFTPEFKAPDEQAHYNYIKYIVEHHELPIQTNQTNNISNDYEYYQPPFYYLLLSPIFIFSNNAFHNGSDKLILYDSHQLSFG